MDVLHPVGDGVSLGDVRIVGGNGDGVTRFDALSPLREEASNHVALSFAHGATFETAMQARGPIGFGEAVMRGRFAVLEGDGGIELAISLWGEEPRRAVNASKLIAETNFTMWHREWQEHALALIGRQADQVAAFMGNLWLRLIAVSASGGSRLPTIGVSALWLETPTACGRPFSNDFSTVPENTLVRVRTFSGRVALARRVNGERIDENGVRFEVENHSLPAGADGNIQASRAVNGWGQ